MVGVGGRGIGFSTLTNSLNGLSLSSAIDCIYTVIIMVNLLCCFFICRSLYI